MYFHKIIFVSILVFILALLGCSSASTPKITFKVSDSSNNEIPNNNNYEFPSILKNTKITQEFMIENTGNTILKLTGNPIVEIDGTGANAFSILEYPNTPIKPNASTTFKIEFSPAVSQSFDATVTILNNSKDLTSFKFKINGIGLEPGLNAKQETIYIPNSIGSFDFGNVRVAKLSSEITFTIENSSSNDLNLTGTPKIEVTGADTSMFTLNQSAVTSLIAPFDSTTFTIIFSPQSLGLKSAIVSFATDDTNKNPYTFTIRGTGVLPEINVKQRKTDILSGTGNYDFGKINVNGTSSDITFTIENLGFYELNLTGSPKIDLLGTDAAMFTINQVMTTKQIAPIDSTTFIVRFNPASSGNKSATISIANDDTDENPYTFTVEGIGISPEINVKQGATNLPSGSGVYNFGTVLLQKVSQEVTFTIENIGNADLKLTGTQKIQITGAYASMFTVSQTLTSLIAPASTTTFTVKFSPTITGHTFATISIPNNDPDENPYTFKVIGTTTKFDFNGDNYDDVIVGAPYDDDGGSSSGCAFIFFGSANPIPIIDASNADIKFVGENIGDCFGVSVSSAGDVNGDGYDDVIVGASDDDDGGNHSGCAFIFFGSSYPYTKISASGADVKLIGEQSLDYFGSSVSNAGDVNKDGFDDIIVGADNNSNNAPSAGCAYVFLGSANLVSTINASNADIKLVGTNANNYFGNIVSCAGDVNNDGFDDVMAVATQYSDGSKLVGCTFIFFGGAKLNSTIDASNANVLIFGDDINDHFACSISSAGDVNGDGFDDIIIGAYGDDDGGSSSGCSFIFFGSTNLPQQLYSSNANVKLIGKDADDYFGNSVSSAGDINGDGFDDIIIGADGNKAGGISSGSAYLFFGNSNLASIINASKADVKLIGEASYNEFGCCVNTAGDVNNDGLNDVIVGAKGCSDGGSTSGNVYVFLGNSNPTSTIDASIADIKLVGEDSADVFGYSVAGGK